MKPEEIRQLLGGYASGTLSEAEKKLLFEAALEDQVLFDAMADEQALKDLLDHPESRGYLQAVLDEVPADPARPSLVASRAAPAAPAPPQMAPSRVAPKRPSMWWGALAAAALATVSVIAILRIDSKVSRVEMTKVEVPKSETEIPPAADKGNAAGSTPAPAKPKSAASSPAKPEVKHEANAKVAALKLPEPAASAGESERRAKAVQQSEEKQKSPRDEPPTPVLSVAPPPPAPAVQQPQQQQQQKEVSQQVAVATSNVSQDQLQQLRLQGQLQSPGARQLYFAPGEQTGAAAGRASVEVSSGTIPLNTTTETAAKDQEASKPAIKKKAAAGAIAASRLATPAPRSNPAKAAFAMRYKILRKVGQDFVQVPPETRFHIGEEVVLVIEKNSGGVAAIERIGQGSSAAVAMAVQTNELARSVPITVTGPMELALVLTRDAAAVRGIPPPPASQKTEIADGMVYVAEPAASTATPLVVRVSIRVE